MDDWKDSLPDEYKDTTLVKEAKTIEDVVKTALNSQTMLGNSVRIPSENASEDDRKAFTEKLVSQGYVPKDRAVEFLRPEDPAHYKLDAAPVDAADLGLQQADIDNLKVQAHKLGLSKEQFQDYANVHIDRIRQTKDAQRQKHLESNDQLMQDWGPDAFDGKRVQALQAIRRYGGMDLAKKIDADPDPDLLRAFAEIGQQFEEQGMGDLETPIFKAESREEAQAKLDEIMGNPDHAYHKGSMAVGSTRYNEVLSEVLRLRRIAMGQSGRVKDPMFG